MTKAEKREALVELVVLAWKHDREAEYEAANELREQGIDHWPLICERGCGNSGSTLRTTDRGSRRSRLSRLGPD